jgi:hypothetical protein
MTPSRFDLFRTRLTEDRRSVAVMLDRLRERDRFLAETTDLVGRLPRSWRDDDPGKYGDHCFFVRDYVVSADGKVTGLDKVPLLEWCDHFHATEVVDDLDAARRGRKDRFRRDTVIPVPLAPIADAMSARQPVACRFCGSADAGDAVVIGSYAQTCDGPDGDTWCITLYQLCVTDGCGALTPIAQRYDDHRMTHRLTKPVAMTAT